MLEPIEPEENPAVGSKVAPSEATTCPHRPRTKPRASPDAFPPEIAEVYFVSSIPFVTRGVDLAVIAVFSIAVSFLATIIPSMRAARLNPVEALRYE